MQMMWKSSGYCFVMSYNFLMSALLQLLSNLGIIDDSK